MTGPLLKRKLAALNQGNGHTLRRRFTVEEFYRMAAAGIFGEDDRVELVAGDVVDMMPVSARHAACVKRLNYLLNRGVGEQAIVGVQDPLRLDEHTEVLPDVMLLRPRADFYAQVHPGPADVLLVVEVAETSLAYDREVKGRLYARHRIPEYWLVDLEGERVLVHRRPKEGRYTEVRTVGPGDVLTVEALPDVRVPVQAILGNDVTRDA